MTDNRAIWSYTGEDWIENDGTIEAVVLENGGVHFSVTEEQAVDSYNQEFSCSVTVPQEQLAGLKALIDAALEAKK